MPADVIRRAVGADLSELTRIYNHYVVHTAVTFDTEPWSIERRGEWLAGFSDSGRHQLFVAEQDGTVVGYGGSSRFRVKAAYHSTVESTVYLDPAATGRGLGSLLYKRLFDALEGTGVHRVLAGMTLPNEASSRLHDRLGFRSCGVMHEVGHKLGRYWDVEWLERSVD